MATSAATFCLTVLQICSTVQTVHDCMYVRSLLEQCITVPTNAPAEAPHCSGACFLQKTWALECHSKEFLCTVSIMAQIARQSLVLVAMLASVRTFVFPERGFYSGTYSGLADRLTQPMLPPAEAPSRLGALRYVQRSQSTQTDLPPAVPPPRIGALRSVFKIHSANHGVNEEYSNWKDGKIFCPAGKYLARFEGSDRLSIETTLKLPSASCESCPQGRFNSKAGEVSIDGCVSCPAGRYGLHKGSDSVVSGCELCPIGTFGSERGMTSRFCSGFCPAGQYGTESGLTLASSCMKCPAGYSGTQCGQPNRHPGGADGKQINMYSGGEELAFHGKGFETRLAAIQKRSRAWETATRGNLRHGGHR